VTRRVPCLIQVDLILPGWLQVSELLALRHVRSGDAITGDAVPAPGAMPRARTYARTQFREIMFSLLLQQLQRQLLLRRRSQSSDVVVRSAVKTVWRTATGAAPFYTAILRREQAKIRRK